MLKVAVSFVTVFLICGVGVADEADQFLSWGVELSDAAPALNSYVDAQVRAVLDEANAAGDDDCDCETLTLEIFARIYLDRLRGNLLAYIEETDTIDVHPSREVSIAAIKDLSIYRNATLPYVIRVTRTIRVGEVYIGVDKLAHFFGFGRRYYKRYMRDRRGGQTEEAAVEEAILWGVLSENTIVGRAVNGIFSHADLEANYQGLELARDLCEGPKPYLRNNGKGWVSSRSIDLRDYVVPGFDESYNLPDWTNGLLDIVLPAVAGEYENKGGLQSVTDRFRAYRKAEPSRSMEVIQQHLREQGIPSQRDKLLEALKLSPNHPAAPFDPRRIDATAASSP